MSNDSWEEDDWTAIEEAECYHGAEFCIDPFCRDICSCIGCDILIPSELEAEK